jgi:hypothetical protein
VNCPSSAADGRVYPMTGYGKMVLNIEVILVLLEGQLFD